MTMHERYHGGADGVFRFRWGDALSLSEGEYRARCESLKRRGLLDAAEQEYPVRICIKETGERVCLRAFGASREWDLILQLAADRIIKAPQVYRFTAWPRNEQGEERFVCEVGEEELVLERIRELRKSPPREQQTIDAWLGNKQNRTGDVSMICEYDPDPEISSSQIIPNPHVQQILYGCPQPLPMEDISPKKRMEFLQYDD